MKCSGGMMRSGFGEVYVGINQLSNDYVAIKRLRIDRGGQQFLSESKLLRTFNSRYIVRYGDVIRSEKELWVRVFTVSLRILDNYGILQVWIPWRFCSKW